MEEVWENINLASLHDNLARSDPTRTNHNLALNFQDFLARPVDRNPPNTTSGGRISPEPPPPPSLSLNSGTDQFNYLLSHSDPLRSNPILQALPVLNGPPPNADPFDIDLTSSDTGRKRLPECENNSADRRHKRMIKNRESASRSRARKQECSSLLCIPYTYTSSSEFICSFFFKKNQYFVQCIFAAYTNELELEVAHLMEENARLKRQQQQQQVN
ncbi:Basic-leucine zipper (bZIP) transcription factor family protein [Actinidia rufa]|uniref:Basic-leucine zipper (BZIP) transcription factor family protein n=1 Tax=Actinidia rufa TaxID=165716 RepID=A0A7J0E1Y6_9ERIC|nr:Basic-leucine zipper (bZIP) transcription factor family protein [Actinidia rufa]